jgi:hypothetical protein
LAGLAAHADMESLREFAKFFWQQTEDLSKPISNLIEKLIAAQLSMGSFDYRSLRASIEKAMQRDEHRYAIVSRLASVEVSSQEIDRMPGTRLFVDVFWQYVLEKMDRFANLKSNDFAKAVAFKRSDFADLTHVLYCPYVDIFGCDGEMKTRIRRAGWPTEKVVANDRELAEALTNSSIPGL